MILVLFQSRKVVFSVSREPMLLFVISKSATCWMLVLLASSRHELEAIRENGCVQEFG